jgi:DNA mismatch endonuclease (patch repair protein)
MPQRSISRGGGQIVPYPAPTSPGASRIGRGNKRTGTTAEVALRRALHGLGLRFRKDLLVRLVGVKTHVDIAFTRPRLAVFVDGCFWHGCPEHGTTPRANSAYWVPKLARNLERDREVDDALASSGWTVLRVWEHEVPEPAASTVVAELVRLGHQPAIRMRATARTDSKP